MKLSCRILDNVANVNSFTYVTEASFTEGDGASVYLQLIDTSLDRSEHGFHPAGRRYMPASGATLSVVVDSLDDSKKITRSATQPFSNDPSIWKITFLSTDTIRGTCSIKLTLVEGSTTTRGSAHAVIRIHNQDTF